MTEKPNTLLSRSTVRIIDVLTEGEIEDLETPSNILQSIYLNGTPVVGSDGLVNIPGVKATLRKGTQNQAFVPGFVATQNEVSVGVKLTKDAPFVRTISDADMDAVIVKIRIPQLTTTNVKNGDMTGGKVVIEFDIKPNGGAYTKVGSMTISGKCTSPYERAKRIDLPSGGDPWTFRIRRITEDSKKANVQNDSYVSSYTEIFDVKLNYPNVAHIGLTFDAKYFSSIPTRVYKGKWMKWQIPSNYNPITRVYTGVWNGTFTTAWTNNPAWILYGLMTNKRFGLGRKYAMQLPDKYALYNIGKYCDGNVPDGQGGQEPRYVFNGIIDTQEDAAKVLDAISSVFRGMIYYGAGTVIFTNDAPATPVKLVTPANVIGGKFNYAGSSIKSRHTSVIVSWNDPNEQGKKTYEVVQRDDLIKRYGFNQITVNAYGTTSKSQARRVGEWLIDSEQNENEVVKYTASLDHADVRPGQIIKLLDPKYAGLRYGGRVIAATSTQITIDSPLTLTSGVNYSISVVLPDGSIGDANVSTRGSNVTVLNLSTSLGGTPIVGAMWVLTSDNLSPRLFRVISNFEKEKNKFEIMALFHDPTKYARIERDRLLNPPDYSVIYRGQLKPPFGLTAKPFKRQNVRAIHIAWQQPNNEPRVNYYQLQVQRPGDDKYREIENVDGLSYDDYPVKKGTYKFRVRAVGGFSPPSKWVEYSHNLTRMKEDLAWPDELVTMQADLADDPLVDKITNFTIAVNGRTSILAWATIPDPELLYYQIRYNANTSGATWDNSSILQSYVAPGSTSVSVPSASGTYLIKGVSEDGEMSENAKIVTCDVGYATENIVAVLNESAWRGKKFTSLLPRANQVDYSTWTRVNTSVINANTVLQDDGATDGDGLRATGVAVTSLQRYMEIDAAVTADEYYEFTFDDLTDKNHSYYITITDGTNYACAYFNSYVNTPSTWNAFDQTVFSSGMTANKKFEYGGHGNKSRYGIFVKIPTGVSSVKFRIGIHSEGGTPVTTYSQLTAGYVSASNIDVALYNVNYKANFVSGTEVFNGQLRLKSARPVLAEWGTLDTVDRLTRNYVSQGEYYFDVRTDNTDQQPSSYRTFDLGSIVNCAITAEVRYTVIADLPVLRTWPVLDNLGILAGDQTGINVRLQIRYSNDAPSANNWSVWADYLAGLRTFRYCQFRLVLTSSRPNVSPAVTSVKITLDMDDRIESGNDIACPSGGLTVTYSKQFMAVPNVHVNAQNLNTGDYWRVTAKTVSGFTIQFFNSSNVAKSSTFDYLAKGYGAI